MDFWSFLKFKDMTDRWKELWEKDKFSKDLELDSEMADLSIPMILLRASGFQNLDYPSFLYLAPDTSAFQFTPF